MQHHPDLVKKYLGSVVPHTDNFFAALNSAVFSDGSFAYIPKGVRCPMELSTYFRINAKGSGQFERTLIVAEEGAYVSYLEGCTAPMRDEHQLHAAVVELVALDNATIKYSTIQNWYPGDKDGKGGIYNFVTKRGALHRRQLEDHLDAGGDRLGHHLEVSELHPAGRQLGRRVLLGRDDQQHAAGRHRHQDDPPREEHPQHDRLEGHLGRQGPEHLSRPGADREEGRQARATTRSATRCSSATSAARTRSRISRSATPARRWSTKRPRRRSARTRFSICRQRGLSAEDAVNMIVNGFCKDVFRELPMEFAVEAQKLLSVSLEGVGRINVNQMLEINESAGPRRQQGHPPRHQPDASRRAKCTPSWGRTAPARARSPARWPAIRSIEVTGGTVTYNGKDLLEMAPEDRAREGVFMAFQYPVEIPGVNNAYFLKAAINAQRKHRGLPELDAMEFMALVREKAKILHLDPTLLSRPVNEGFSGGEKKRNEIFQMAVLEPKLAVLDETDSGLDIDALKTVAEGVNAMRSPERAIIVITHYQRLLNYIEPDFVHVLQDGRIVRSGGKDLALHLEEKGYSWIEAEPQLM